MKTDKQFDRALEWLARKEKRSKSEVVRDAVLRRYASRSGRFPFGALRHLHRRSDAAARIVRELRTMDRDDDLD